MNISKERKKDTGIHKGKPTVLQSSLPKNHMNVM